MALTHYLDARLRVDDEVRSADALAALFQRLHLYLAQTRAGDIAVSFPELTRTSGCKVKRLGNVLRMHGSAGGLGLLMQPICWGGAVAFADFGNVNLLPANVLHHRIRRVQVDSNPERLMRRAMKRKGWTEDQARQAYAGAQRKLSTLPFISMNSRSTGQRFSLLLDVGVPIDTSTEGSFNAYGLSQEATVPYF